jgi:hypothetical protein
MQNTSPSSLVPGVSASLSDGATDALRDLEDGVEEPATLRDDCLASFDSGVLVRAEAGVALGDLVGVVPVTFSDSLSLIFLLGVEDAVDADLILAMPFFSFDIGAGRFLPITGAGAVGVAAASGTDWSTDDALDAASDGSVLT